MPTAGEEPPAPLILSTEPVEDSGSETLDRFEFQLHCATRHCLDLIESTAELVAVVCCPAPRFSVQFA